MKKIKILLVLCLAATTVFSQKKEDKAIKKAIEIFFEGLNTGDSAKISSVCTQKPMLQSFMANQQGELEVMTDDWQDFLNQIGSKPANLKIEERIEFGNVEWEQSLASVWTPYTFWINGKLNHCGTNAFLLVKETAGWKIQTILDTRRKQGCK